MNTEKLSMVRLQNKRVIVTGGASGIGRAIAKSFSREGAEVIVADLSASKAEQVAAELGGETRGCAVDVGDADAVDAMIESAGDRLDVLVCAAGLFRRGTAEETALDDWRRVLDTNLTGTFLCAKAAIPLMRSSAP